MPEPKNWHKFAEQNRKNREIDPSVTGPFKVGDLVESTISLPNPKTTKMASGMHADESYFVEGYNATGGVILRGYVWPVSAKHLRLSNKPNYR